MSRIFELLNELYENFETFRTFINEPSSYRFEEFGDEFQNYGDTDEIEVEWGATKGVLMEIDTDYVIKIPFIEEHDFDYCAYEETVLEEAAERGLEEFFAETESVGEYHGVPIYKMERVEVNYDKLLSKYGEEYSKSCKKSGTLYSEVEMTRRFESFDGEYYIDFFNELFFEKGKKKIEELTYFLSDFDVNDLHIANMGVNSNNEVVFIDYSGYWGR